MLKPVSAVLVCALALGMTPAFAAEPAAAPATADNMQILRDKIKADKKLVVAANMELTEAESKAFWPVYEAYQGELKKLNERTMKLIESYAAEYNAGTMNDDKAKKAVDEMVAIDEAEAAAKKALVPKLTKAVPAKKAARYMQIENKIRAAIKYELAANIPLVN